MILSKIFCPMLPSGGATWCAARGALFASMLVSALGVLCANAGGEKELLAPTGHLRVGVYPGSPTSMVTDAGSGQTHGLTYDLGREFAARIGATPQYVTFPRIADVIGAMKEGQIDFTITNATPARTQVVDFTPPLVALELGYLALPGSLVQSLADVDQPGMRIGVSQGSTSQGTLTREFKQARVVPALSLQVAGEMLQRREIDAFATNKAVLHELGDGLPGARVLDGRWGLEHLAIAVPKGRGAASEYLRGFAQSVRSEGLVQAASSRAGLRGTADLP
jgi:polar amino acid transport system substrate-binding protein